MAIDAATLPPPAGWLPPGSDRPLGWWDERGLHRLAHALQAALAAWQAAWGLEHPALEFRAAPVRTALPPDRAGVALVAGSRASAWWQPAPGTAARIHAALFADAGEGGPLSRAVALKCGEDAALRIARLFSLQVQAGPAPEDADDLRPHSGAVRIEATGLLAGRLLLGAATAAAWNRRNVPQPRPGAPAHPLTSLADALAGHRLPLSACLEGCELEVASLQRLQVGDVVRIAHRLDAPAMLTDAAGRALLAGYLGRSGSRKAMELAALPA